MESLLIDRTDIRTILLVPLRKDGAFLGYISAYRQEVRPFSEKEIALLENFAAQAVIAMENARLITEHGRRWSSRPRPPRCCRSSTPRPAISAPVFDAMLEKAMRLCGAAFEILGTFGAGRLHHARGTRRARRRSPSFLAQNVTAPGPGAGSAKPLQHRTARAPCAHIRGDDAFTSSGSCSGRWPIPSLGARTLVLDCACQATSFRWPFTALS